MPCTPNPESLREQLSLTVEKADGTLIPVAAQPLLLRPGANVTITVLEDGDEAQIACGAGSGTELPYYRQKYNTLATLTGDVSGPFPDPDTGVTPVIPPGKTTWEFTTASRWVAKIANILGQPVSGNFFFGGSPCISVGEFENPDYNLPELTGGLLHLVDICAPCVDCQTWDQLNAYFQRISEFYDYMYSLCNDPDTSTIPEYPDGGIRENFTGVYQQHMAVLRYWDYLVHRSTTKLAAQSYGQSIVTAVFYRNISDGEIGTGTGIDYTIRLSFYKKVGEDFCPWGGLSSDFISVRALDRTDKNSAWVTDTQFLSGGIVPPCTELLPGAHTIEITMHCDALASGDECYADVAVLFKDIDAFENGEYLVNIYAKVDPTHIVPPGYEEKETTVYFLPPEPTASSSSSSSSAP